MITTRDQQREALIQIKAIVESHGEDSYLAAAFDGCFEIAEDNINNRLKNSFKEIANSQLSNKVNIGTRINGYMIIAAANGYVLGINTAAPDPFVVWTVDNDGNGVHTGRYFNDRMDAEWEFCSLAFEWFQDNVLISDDEDEEYRRRSAEARVEALEENLSAAHRSLAAAMDLVEEMFKERDRLFPKDDRVTDEPVDKVARGFAEDIKKMLEAITSAAAKRDAPQGEAAEHTKYFGEFKETFDKAFKQLEDWASSIPGDN